VLGEYVVRNITIESSKITLPDTLIWRPIRRGQQLWEVGIPNRNASEFYMADQRRDPSISLKYAELFPNDITFTVGKSKASKDWFFQHVPHNETPDAQALPFRGVNGVGRATPYKVLFDLSKQPTSGTATLRIAFCGTNARTINVEVNGQNAGDIRNLSVDNVLIRHGSQGMWYERELSFPANMLKQGTNTLTLIMPAGSVNSGVMYDYIRLELDDSK
jgi:rhamnogalacturonan endolyase